MIAMTTAFKSFAAAAVLLAASQLPVHAEDAPAATTAPAATQGTNQGTAAPADNSKPALVPRPSIAPKTTEAAPEAAGDASQRRHRRTARHYRRYANWEPFPIYFPHVYHHRLVWNRMRWF
jgi:hypothetical protein